VLGKSLTGGVWGLSPALVCVSRQASPHTEALYFLKSAMPVNKNGFKKCDAG
jgi:hypothetical protein